MSEPDRVSLPHEQSEFAETRAAERAESARRSTLAARAVASHSLDVDDCTALLAMLGLDASTGRFVETVD
jgi:hypothetical protein